LASLDARCFNRSFSNHRNEYRGRN
jgi:hypothetical protein